MTAFAAAAGHVSHGVVSPWVALGVYVAGVVIAAREGGASGHVV